MKLAPRQKVLSKRQLLQIAKQDLPRIKSRQVNQNPLTSRKRSKTEPQLAPLSLDSRRLQRNERLKSIQTLESSVQTELILPSLSLPRRQHNPLSQAALALRQRSEESSSDWQSQQAEAELNRLKQKSARQSEQRRLLLSRQMVAGLQSRFQNALLVRRNSEFAQRVFALKSNPTDYVLRALTDLKIAPKSIELIKYFGDRRVLLLDGLNLVASKSLQKVALRLKEEYYFTAMSFANNGLRQLPPHLSDCFRRCQMLDLSANNLSFAAVKNLTSALDGESSLITELVLIGCKLSDSSCEQLCRSLVKLKHLRLLNLSKNCMAKLGSEALSQLLLAHCYLEELYLHWNRIDELSVVPVFAALAQNCYLRVLDLSWNNLGGSHQPKIKLLASLLQKTALVHLDMSYCQFGRQQGESIAAALPLNRKTIGIHFLGLGRVDYKGNLLHVGGSKIYPPSSSIGTVLIAGVRAVKGCGQNCWICEGWVELHLKLAKDGLPFSPFIHFDWEDYNAVNMVETDTDYEIKRMCPPRQIYFFFSLGPRYNFVSEQWASAEGRVLERVRWGRKVRETVLIQKLNSVKVARGRPLFGREMEWLGGIRPRFVDTQVVVKTKTVRVRRDKTYPQLQPFQLPPFVYEQSVFYRRVRLAEHQFRSVVECDVALTKLSAMLEPDQLAAVCQYFTRNFKEVRTLYQYIASRSETNGEFGLKLAEIIPLFSDLKVIGPGLPTSTVELKYIAAISEKLTEGDSKKIKSDYFQMFLSQFYEFVVRIAGERKTEPVVQSLAKLFAKFELLVRAADPELWRKQRYQTSQCHFVYSSFRGLFKKLFMGSAKLNPKIKKFTIRYHDFFQLLKPLLKTKEMERTCAQMFFISKQIMENEGAQPAQLRYFQFVQAFFRMAQAMSLPPVCKQNSKIPPQSLARLPLCFKAESLLYSVYNQFPQYHKKKFNRLFASSLFSVLAKDLNGILKIQVASEPLLPGKKGRAVTQPRVNTFRQQKTLGLQEILRYRKQVYETELALVQAQEDSYMELEVQQF